MYNNQLTSVSPKLTFETVLLRIRYSVLYIHINIGFYPEVLYIQAIVNKDFSRRKPKFFIFKNFARPLYRSICKGNWVWLLTLKFQEHYFLYSSMTNSVIIQLMYSCKFNRTIVSSHFLCLLYHKVRRRSFFWCFETRDEPMECKSQHHRAWIIQNWSYGREQSWEDI